MAPTYRERLIIYAKAHHVADARVIGDSVRIASHATIRDSHGTVDCTMIEYVSSLHELRAVLGY